MTSMRLTILVVVLAASLAACGRTGESSGAAAPAATGAGWAMVRDGLIEEYLKAHPVFAVVGGRHEYDGRLPDWSADGIAAEIARLHAARDRALSIPEAALSDAERFERDYLVARFDRDLFWLEDAEAPFHNPAWYLDWIVDNLDPAPYLTRNYAPLETRMAAYTRMRARYRRQPRGSEPTCVPRSRGRCSIAACRRSAGSPTSTRATSPASSPA